MIAVANRMKKSAAITLTMAVAIGANAQSPTPLPPCAPNKPVAGQNTVPCKKPGRSGLAGIFHGGFGSTGAGTTSRLLIATAFICATAPLAAES